MPKGNAFNKLEVDSRYVGSEDRYVVSLIVGFSKEQVDTPQAAAAAMIEMMRADRGDLHVSVHDRETQETHDLTTREVAILTSMPPGVSET